MEDIILVTGCHRTRSWANIVFLESHTDAQPEVSFGVDVTNGNGPEVINWRFSPDRSRGAELNLGPDGEVCYSDVRTKNRDTSATMLRPSEPSR